MGIKMGIDNSKMRIIFCMILLITIFSMPLINPQLSIYAKNYNPTSKEITVKDQLNNDVLKLKLLKNTDGNSEKCRGIDGTYSYCEAIINITPLSLVDISDFKVNFFELNKITATSKVKSSSFQYLESISTNTFDCEDSSNKTILCSEASENWKDLDFSKASFTIGKATTFKLSGIVKSNSRIEWIPSVLELNLDSWGIWDSSSMIFQYKLDENIWNNVQGVNDTTGIYNAFFYNRTALLWVRGYQSSNLSNYAVFSTNGSLPTSYRLPRNQNFTLNMWINGSLSNYSCIYGNCSSIVFTTGTFQESGGGHGINFYVNNTNISQNDPGNTSNRIFNVFPNVFDSNWHMITLVVNGSNASYYVDGSYIKAGNWSLYGDVFSEDYFSGFFTFFSAANASRTTDNGGNEKPAGWFNGSLDMITLYNYDLNLTEIVSLNSSASIQTVPITLTITYPLNTTYTINVSYFNYTVSSNITNCSFSRDNGLTNISIVCGKNMTTMNSTEGINIWHLYVNDSLGNKNSTNVTFFKDTIFPLITTLSPLNTTYTYTPIDFNVTTNENASWCGWDMESSCDSGDCPIYYLTEMTKINNTFFNSSYTFSEGWNGVVYQYKIWFSCNDTLGNINDTSNTTYFIVDAWGPAYIINIIKLSDISANFTVSSEGVPGGKQMDRCNLTLKQGLSTILSNANMTNSNYSSNKTFNYTATGLSLDNTYTLYVTCNDTLGNSRSSKGINFYWIHTMSIPPIYIGYTPPSGRGSLGTGVGGNQTLIVSIPYTNLTNITLVICGNGICEQGEEYLTCPYDCGINIDNLFINCFDNNPETKCLWGESKFLIYIFIGVVGVVVIAIYTSSAKKRKVNKKQTTFHSIPPPTKRRRR